MTENTYTYQTTVTLPDGRFLKDGETLEAGDLYLSGQGLPNPIEEITPIEESTFPAKVANVFGTKYYRPTIPKYYYLKEGDMIKEGDEWKCYEPQTYWTKNHSCTGTTLLRCNEGWCRRKILKPTPKYRILAQDEFIKEGDQWYNSSTRGWTKVNLSIETLVSSHRGIRYRRKAS
jgi:hypothetical protein